MKINTNQNTLIFQNPELAKDWNTLRNYPLSTSDVKPNSTKKVWWICDKGHEWQATISSRNAGHKCPFCSNRKPLTGFNDLKTLYPELSKEWNYVRNSSIFPENVVPGSEKKVWWICKRGA